MALIHMSGVFRSIILPLSSGGLGTIAGRVRVIYTGHLAFLHPPYSLYTGPRLAAKRQVLEISMYDTVLLLGH